MQIHCEVVARDSPSHYWDLAAANTEHLLVHYNQEWVFRILLVTLRHMYQNNWLYGCATCLISDPPSTDQSGNNAQLIQAIDGDIGVKETYERYHIASPFRVGVNKKRSKKAKAKTVR